MKKHLLIVSEALYLKSTFNDVLKRAWLKSLAKSTSSSQKLFDFYHAMTENILASKYGMRCTQPKPEAGVACGKGQGGVTAIIPDKIFKTK